MDVVGKYDPYRAAVVARGAVEQVLTDVRGDAFREAQDQALDDAVRDLALRVRGAVMECDQESVRVATALGLVEALIDVLTQYDD